MARLRAAGWTYSIGVRQQKRFKAAVAVIPEPDWQPLDDYRDGGQAQIAQTTLGSQGLNVRRTPSRRTGRTVARHHAFFTNSVEALERVRS